MKSKILALNDDIVEIIHNPILSNKSFMIRLTNYSNEKYEMTLNKDNIEGLAEFINDFLKG